MYVLEFLVGVVLVSTWWCAGTGMLHVRAAAELLDVGVVYVLLLVSGSPVSCRQLPLF